MGENKISKLRGFAWLPAITWAVVVLLLCILPVVFIYSLIKYLPSGTRDVYHTIREMVSFARMLGLTIQLDKVAHFGMHFVFGILMVFGCYFSGLGVSVKTISFSGLAGALYGFGTEYLQSFTATRGCDINDAYANLIGLACGLFLGALLVKVIRGIVSPLKLFTPRTDPS